ncbi:MAG: DUF3857 domain-containing protein [Bacteroidia bacterium]|nr:DUF3857 domain-containing protein [Bacteroidia bacterium]MCF8446351.1 DUF3857 domain-containing protein [Bacteroidia bacterium]
MFKRLITLVLVLNLSQVFGQFSMPHKFNSKVDFSAQTKAYDLKTIDEFEVVDERVIEFAYDKEGNLFEYYYQHEVRYVNSNEAIDRNNKIYVSLANAFELVDYDVRVILSNGGIKSIGKDALKEGTSEDKQKVQYFAVSGAEKGSMIEYYYLIKRPAHLTGNIYSFQADKPKARVIFKVISPENLFFKSQSFNGFPNLRIDTTLSERNMLVADTNDIPAIFDEPFSNDQANKQKVIYQLYYNTAKGKINPFNYGLVSQSIFENICNKLTKDEEKALDKLMKSANIKYAPDEVAKIRAIENYVKKSYNFVESSDDRFADLASIMKVGALNENGATKMIYHMLTRAGIDKELVVTSNRFNNPFDKEFESYAYLTSFLLYFPKLDKYLCPFAQTYRFGLVPSGYTHNYGLFIRKISVGDLNTGAGKVKFIPAPAAEITQHNMNIKAKLDASGDSLDIDFDQEYKGYYAQTYQSYFDYIPKDKMKDYEEGIVKSLNEEITIKSIKIENKKADDFMVLPLLLHSKLTSAHFIEKAGNKILLKFGDLIGPQSELYQEKARQLPVENTYNRIYNREIVFTIPEGYQIKNAEELNLVVQPFKEKGDGCGFTASYKMDGQNLIVTSTEYYNEILFPLDQYENYRAVINAAANFNKIVLVLEKK